MGLRTTILGLLDNYKSRADEVERLRQEAAELAEEVGRLRSKLRNAAAALRTVEGDFGPREAVPGERGHGPLPAGGEGLEWIWIDDPDYDCRWHKWEPSRGWVDSEGAVYLAGTGGLHWRLPAPL